MKGQVMADTIRPLAPLVTIALAAAFLFGTGKVWAEPLTYKLDSKESTLKFIGHATFHGFVGRTRSLQGKMVFDPESQVFTGPEEVIAPVQSIHTGIWARNQAMWRMFDAEHYPNIRFTPTKATKLEDGRYRVEGLLKVREVERPISFKVKASVSGDAIEATGEVPLTTTLFDLKPPSAAGIIRVRKDVLVQFTVYWKRA